MHRTGGGGSVWNAVRPRRIKLDRSLMNSRSFGRCHAAKSFKLTHQLEGAFWDQSTNVNLSFLMTSFSQKVSQDSFDHNLDNLLGAGPRSCVVRACIHVCFMLTRQRPHIPDTSFITKRLCCQTLRMEAVTSGWRGSFPQFKEDASTEGTPLPHKHRCVYNEVRHKDD